MAANDNLTAVLYGIDDIRLEQRPIPQINDNQVLLKMDTVGICGSDVHYLVHGRIGNFVVEKPMVIGHEASGIVHQIGKKVTHLKVGDRVAIEPGVPCRYCDYCKTGRYNLCPDIAFCATPPFDGNLTKYFAHAADFCFKLPDHVTMEEGVLVEPLAVGVHACRRTNVSLGTTVAIFGAGPIGLATLAAAKSMGAGKILITDIIASRLTLAKELGATHTFCVSKNSSEQDNLKLIKDELGEEPNVSIECSGVEPNVRLSILCTKSGGCVILVGLGASEVKIPLADALIRQVDIKGLFRYNNDYPAALALVANGQVDVKKLITHHFDITETEKAFETVRYNIGGAIKVMIHCTPQNQNNPVPL